MTSASVMLLRSPEVPQFSGLIRFFCFFSRSSDSDGAFETPESTTPVKTASPVEPQAQQLPSDDKGILPLIIHLLIINSSRRIRRRTQRKDAKI